MKNPGQKNSLNKVTNYKGLPGTEHKVKTEKEMKREERAYEGTTLDYY